MRAPVRLGDLEQAGRVHGRRRAFGDARERLRVHGVPDLADHRRTLADREVHRVVHRQNSLAGDFQAVDVQADRGAHVDDVVTRVGVEDAGRAGQAGHGDRRRAVGVRSRHAGGQGAVREVDGLAVRAAGEGADGAGTLVVGAGLATEVHRIADFRTVLRAVAAGGRGNAVVRVVDAVGLAAQGAGEASSEDGSAACAAEVLAVAVFAVFLDAVVAGRAHATRTAGARGATTASAGGGRAAITRASGAARTAGCRFAFSAFGVFRAEALAVQQAGCGEQQRGCGESENQ